jgi:hypothetical protein
MPSLFYYMSLGTKLKICSIKQKKAIVGISDSAIPR